MSKVKNKKGVEMSMNMIVMVVLALIVLIVLTVLFAQRFGLFSSELTSCERNLNGVCTSSADCKKYGGSPLESGECKNQVCCVSPCSMAGGKPVESASGECEANQNKVPVLMKAKWVCCKDKTTIDTSTLEPEPYTPKVNGDGGLGR